MRLLFFVLCLFFSVSVAHAAPDLSSAYAKPATGIAMTLLKQAEPFSAPGEMPKEDPGLSVVVDDVTAETLRLRYESGLRQHRTGVVLTIVGGIATPVFAFGFIVAAFSGDPGLTAFMGLGTLVGAGVYVAGGVLSSLGAIQATRAVNEVLGIHLSLGTGWAGVALSTVGLLLTPLGLGAFGPLAGALCGVVQLQTANRALRDAGLASISIAPTTNGLQLVGRF